MQTLAGSVENGGLCSHFVENFLEHEDTCVVKEKWHGSAHNPGDPFGTSASACAH